MFVYTTWPPGAKLAVIFGYVLHHLFTYQSLKFGWAPYCLPKFGHLPSLFTSRHRLGQGRPPSLFTYYVTSGLEVIDNAAMFVYITWLWRHFRWQSGRYLLSSSSILPNNSLLTLPTKLNNPLICLLFPSFVCTISNINCIVVLICQSLWAIISPKWRHAVQFLTIILEQVLSMYWTYCWRLDVFVVYWVQGDIYYYSPCGVWEGDVT